MVLYDFVAPLYDPVLEPVYRPFRHRVLGSLSTNLEGATLLDLACGTGQNFPFLASHVGKNGTILGVDLSSGMLRRARRRPVAARVELVPLDARDLPTLALPSVDAVICTYGFSSMRDWKPAFEASWALLKPGGIYLIHDIVAERPTLHARVVEITTRSDFSRRVWEPLQKRCPDFRMEYIDPSAHLFGGRLFAATGTKPL